MLIVGCSLYPPSRPAAAAGGGLPASLAMTAAGSNIVLGALDGEGMYPVTLTGSPGSSDYVGSTAALAGDYLIEVECLDGATCFVGTDNAEPIARSSSALDENVRVNPGVPNLRYNRNLSAVLAAAAYTPTNRVWVERVGLTVNIYEGMAWETKTLWGTADALDTGDRWFQFINGLTPGSYRIRFIAHPGA